MKKLLLALSLATITIVSPLSLSAKAGSSSSSSARATSNVGTKAYSAPAKTQYSSTAIQPTKTIQPTTSTQSTASRPSPTTTSSTTTPTHTTTNTTTHTVEQSSGSGIGTAIVGSLIGSTVGTVVGNSINGNHTAGTTTINNGQPQPYQSTGMAVTSSSQPVYQSEEPHRTKHSGFLSILTWVVYTFIALATLTGLYFLYNYIKRRLMMRTMSYEKNIPTLANQYTKIQTLVSLNTMDSKLQLTKLCTPQMYHHLTTISSENADKGHSNVVNNIKVLDCTTREVVVDTDTNSVYHSVKIRAQFIDYFIDETGAVISGSSTTPVTDIEVWTFVLNNGESTWKLSAIEEYKS